MTEEIFLKDVANHEMQVLMDNGVYRHIRMQQPKSSNMWFEIVTWPGYLAYVGDMGAFTFTRLRDMFEFFRTDQKNGKLGINPSYWSEKLEAVDRDGRKGGYSEFSPEKFREHVEEQIETWVQEYHNGNNFYDCDDEEVAAARKSFETELRGAVKNEIYLYIDDGPHELYKALNDFEFKSVSYNYQFQDAWEWSCEDFTLRFLWCCYALAWSIKKYDEMKDKAVAA